MLKKSVIYVGNKPTMNYVLAVVTQINQGYSSIVLKARGRAIGHAVDIAEIVRNNFVSCLDIDDVRIFTEKIEDNGFSKNVSVIEIVLIKN